MSGTSFDRGLAVTGATVATFGTAVYCALAIPAADPSAPVFVPGTLALVGVTVLIARVRRALWIAVAGGIVMLARRDAVASVQRGAAGRTRSRRRRSGRGQMAASDVRRPPGRHPRARAQSGLIAHTFAVPELGIDVYLAPRSERIGGLDGRTAGTYRFECNVTGHERMTGRVAIP